MPSCQVVSQTGQLPKKLPILSAFLFSVLILFGSTPNVRAATIIVPAGGDLQAAITAAQPGDTIVVQAGATYLGPFTLPNKPGSSYITIESSRAAEIIGRVTPAQSYLLAKLQSNRIAEQIIRTDPGAHHYKLVGLEVSTVAASDFIYDLVRLGGGDITQTTLARTPHDLILDRLWIHGFPTQDLQRGISLNSAETSIINSYISDIHAVATDTQAICGWNGPGPYHIINNYIEGAGENLLFGGADPLIFNLVPSDIEIRRNTFYKPLSWKNELAGGGHWAVKNLLELKNARRVTIDGNVFENNWVDGQSGTAIVFTARNQSGSAPWSTVEDVVFSNNTVRNAQGGIIILHTDAESQGAITSRITISNNLFENLGGYVAFLTLLNNPSNVVITHNTVFKLGNIASLDAQSGFAKGTGLVVNDNLFSEGGYGFFGSVFAEGTAALQGFYNSASYTRNNSAGRDSRLYPSNNTFLPTSSVGFMDLSQANYRLAPNSPLKNAASDGRDVGVDLDALLIAQAFSQPTPTPTPTPAPTPTGKTSSDIVLWAAEAPVRVGNWVVVADPQAAGGKRIANSDLGASKLETPIAHPQNYFELSFNATAGVDYRLWIRSKAENDFWGNDSVFIQFSDSVSESGAPIFRIGTTSATEYNLEDCAGCGDQGWGWQDNGWGTGVLGPTIRFQTSGTHTIRVQTREDGLSIDQIVLSAVKYKTVAPGSLRNDSTILPKAKLRSVRKLW
jgi:hypothetical protein